jgi:major type 1 subunit fimbrin (pilin)
LRVLQFVLSNSIRFIRGSVTTCTPTVVPGGAIRLPAITSSASVLGANGQTAGSTPFSIQLNNCKTNGADANGVTVRTYFNGPRINTSTGNLNVTGTATNVQLQMTNGNGSVINLAGAIGNQNVTAAQVSNGTASMPYTVRYFATGRAGPGTVSSTVNYTIEYP